MSIFSYNRPLVAAKPRTCWEGPEISESALCGNIRSPMTDLE